ncbi:MAG TPA: hypothetical protein VL068_14040 [Microthrixaceae bacterium]|nr:hypothetical protein [Microthrixaceae bacterium]
MASPGLSVAAAPTPKPAVPIPTSLEAVALEEAAEAVSLTIGAPTPKIGRRPTPPETTPLKRRHPAETASQLFPDALLEEFALASESREPEIVAPETPSPDVAESREPVITAGAEAPDTTQSVEPEVADAPAGAAPDVVDSPAPTPEPADAPAGADGPADETPPDEEVAAVPTSPLLARAFAQTGPQRSVLSDDLRVPDHKRPRRQS